MKGFNLLDQRWSIHVLKDFTLTKVKADTPVDVDYIMEIRSEDGEILATSERIHFQQGKTISVALKKPVSLKPGIYKIGLIKPQNRLISRIKRITCFIGALIVLSKNWRYRAMHYQVEILYKTTYKPACNHPTASRMTTNEEEVTCVKCKRLLGHYGFE